MEEPSEISKPYQRPEHVKFPKVWLRFEGRTPKDDGTYPKFRIEDVTEDRIEEIMACWDDFNTDTKLGQAFNNLGVTDKLKEAFVIIWRQSLMEQVSLLCVTDDEDPPRLVGFNVTTILTSLPSTADDLHKQLPREAFAAVNEALLMRSKVNVFKRWNVAKCLDAWGLYVKPEFRGQGVAYNLLAAREPLCKALGILATANGFVSNSATSIAQRVGFELLFKITFPQMEEKYNIRLPGAEDSALTYLGMKY